jgi:hypothetical protein
MSGQQGWNPECDEQYILYEHFSKPLDNNNYKIPMLLVKRVAEREGTAIYLDSNKRVCDETLQVTMTPKKLALLRTEDKDDFIAIAKATPAPDNIQVPTLQAPPSVTQRAYNAFHSWKLAVLQQYQSSGYQLDLI